MARQGLLLLLGLLSALAAASHAPKMYTHRARLVIEVPEGEHVETTQTTVPTTSATEGPTQVRAALPGQIYTSVIILSIMIHSLKT